MIAHKFSLILWIQLFHYITGISMDLLKSSNSTQRYLQSDNPCTLANWEACLNEIDNWKKHPSDIPDALYYRVSNSFLKDFKKMKLRIPSQFQTKVSSSMNSFSKVSTKSIKLFPLEVIDENRMKFQLIMKNVSWIEIFHVERKNSIESMLNTEWWKKIISWIQNLYNIIYGKVNQNPESHEITAESKFNIDKLTITFILNAKIHIRNSMGINIFQKTAIKVLKSLFQGKIFEERIEDLVMEEFDVSIRGYKLKHLNKFEPDGIFEDGIEIGKEAVAYEREEEMLNGLQTVIESSIYFKKRLIQSIKNVYIGFRSMNLRSWNNKNCIVSESTC